MPRKAWLMFAAGLAAGAAGLAVIGAEETSGAAQSGSSQASDRYAELVKEEGEFAETFILPGVDFGQFDKVYFWQAQFEYRDVGPARKTRSTLMSTHKREYGISEEDRQKFEEIVREAFGKEFEKAKYFEVVTDVDAIDTTTLILRGGLLDIISQVPPEMVGRSDIYLSSVGAATFVMELIDARSGNVIALVAERRAIETLNTMSGAMVRASSVSIMSDIRRWSGGLARRLRTALDRAISEGTTA